MRDAISLALAFAVAVSATELAHAEWRDPIGGGTTILPAHFELGDGTLTVHAAPRSQPSGGEGESPRWNQPLVDRPIDKTTRAAPLAPELLATIQRVEPIYDPTLLEGPNVVVPWRISAGTAEMRDLFADHWRIASADANVDADAQPIANAWTAGAKPRPCSAYRVRRMHEWREPALTATSAADCRAIRARQARGFTDAAPLPIAAAVPPLPVFAAPEPGSRMTSQQFWVAQRARINSIHAHLHRKWLGPKHPLESASN